MMAPDNIIFGKFRGGHSISYGMSPVRVSLTSGRRAQMDGKLGILSRVMWKEQYVLGSTTIGQALERTGEYAYVLFREHLDLFKIIVRTKGELSGIFAHGMDLGDKALSLRDQFGPVKCAMRRDHTIFVPDLAKDDIIVLTSEGDVHSLYAADTRKYKLDLSGLKTAGGIRSVIIVPIGYREFESDAVSKFGALVLASRIPGFLDAPGDMVVLRKLANYLARALRDFV